MSQFSGHPLRVQKCWRSHTWCCQKWRRKFVTICSSLASFCWKNINHDCPNRSLNCRKDVCTVWRLHCLHVCIVRMVGSICIFCIVGFSWLVEIVNFVIILENSVKSVMAVLSVQWGYLSVLGGYLVHPDPECADWRKSFSEAVFFLRAPPTSEVSPGSWRLLRNLGGSD